MIPAALASPPISGDPYQLADWLECLALAGDGVASFAVIGRAWDRQRAEEDFDFEGRDASAELDIYLTPVISEISQRIDLLGDAYPFQLTDSGEAIQVDDSLSSGAYIYLFCLLLSVAQTDEILENDTLAIDDRARRLFQSCSTLAAAGDLGGNAINFGAPRADHTGFLTALRSVYRTMSEGSVVSAALPGTSPNPKDEDIDVIAWRPRLDGPGTYYLLGQVATGKNWKGKSVIGAISPFHKLWFTQQPVSTPIPAMFIPYCLELTRGATIAEQLHVLTARYGIVYYRYRLPRFAAQGLSRAIGLSTDSKEVIEGVNDYPEIVNWVKTSILRLRDEEA